MLGDRVWFKCVAVEKAAQDEGAIVLDIVPGEAEEGMFGLEIADLQGAIDLGVKAGTTTDKGQFSFAQRQIFRSLSIVEVGQAVLLGVRQNGQELVLAGHCCAVPPASASGQPIRTSVSISVVRLTPKLRQTAAFDMPPSVRR